MYFTFCSAITTLHFPGAEAENVTEVSESHGFHDFHDLHDIILALVMVPINVNTSCRLLAS